MRVPIVLMRLTFPPGKGECVLQMEAQRISLTQIYAAQLELLQEETDAHTHSPELKLQKVEHHDDQGEMKLASAFACMYILLYI